jgi:hypothetical protein
MLIRPRRGLFKDNKIPPSISTRLLLADVIGSANALCGEGGCPQKFGMENCPPSLVVVKDETLPADIIN